MDSGAGDGILSLVASKMGIEFGTSSLLLIQDYSLSPTAKSMHRPVNKEHIFDNFELNGLTPSDLILVDQDLVYFSQTMGESSWYALKHKFSEEEQRVIKEAFFAEADEKEKRLIELDWNTFLIYRLRIPGDISSLLPDDGKEIIMASNIGFSGYTVTNSNSIYLIAQIQQSSLSSQVVGFISGGNMFNDDDDSSFGNKSTWRWMVDLEIPQLKNLGLEGDGRMAIGYGYGPFTHILTHVAVSDASIYLHPHKDNAIITKDEGINRKTTVDPAIATTKKIPGGIDFNPKNMDLHQQGQKFNFNIPSDHTLSHNVTMEGIEPVITCIQKKGVTNSLLLTLFATLLTLRETPFHIFNAFQLSRGC